MQKIITAEIFSSPQWLKMMYYFSSLILLIMGIWLLINLDIIQGVVLLIPLIFLLAISSLIYTRLKLVISNAGIHFSGGLKPHGFSWANITKVEMDRTGKYRTPKATDSERIIHYVYDSVLIKHFNSQYPHTDNELFSPYDEN